jgi:hypothetical protein
LVPYTKSFPLKSRSIRNPPLTLLAVSPCGAVVLWVAYNCAKFRLTLYLPAALVAEAAVLKVVVEELPLAFASPNETILFRNFRRQCI